MATFAPVPTDVGRMYDVVTELFTTLLDGNIHVGYWHDDQDDTPVAEAATRLTDMVVERVAARPGAQVLDVGCGTGTTSLRLAGATGAAVTGISISRSQVATATARAEAAGLADRARFRYADAMALPFGARVFDAAIAIESVLHMPDQDRALREVGSVLLPGGRLVMADIIQLTEAVGEEQEVLDNFCAVTRCRPVVGLPDKLVRAGFRVVEFTDIGPHVLRAFAELAERMREVRADFAGRIPAGHFDQLVELMRRFSDLRSVGYALVVAEQG
ncbi:SAM-dependent methyltransferase [Saccharothrix xinjiangensis]|uniref:SAM-dependent methyltransferase n=1 Tax=Saccharothrix xinjiangensis TaxID=204798 RepID=A0ABV9Y438_9PSEU